MENGNILVLSERQIMSVLDMPAALESVETSLREIAEGRCINPMKLHMSLRPGIQGYLNSMPSCLLAQDVMGAKLVSVYKDNAKNFSLPVTMGTIVLHHPESGLPFAVLGGTYITALRTGAAAGVGAKYLARKDSHVLLQIGAGAQGRMGAEAILCAMGTVDELRVADISPDALKSFAEEMQEKFPQVRIVPYTDYRKAIPGAQIICAGTTSPQPLLRGMPLDKGVTVLLIAELVDDSDLRWYDRCIMDFPECFCDRINDDLRGWSARTGSPFEEIRLETCSASLGEVIAGKKPGRSSDDERIVVGYPSRKNSVILAAIQRYLPEYRMAPDILMVSLDNLNFEFHPGPTLLYTAMIENGIDFEYYSDFTPSQARLIEAIDQERLALCRAYGVKVRDVAQTFHDEYGYEGTLYEMIKHADVYKGIKGPSALNSRFLTEDIPYSLRAIQTLAQIANISTPTIDTVVNLAYILLGDDLDDGRTLSQLGFNSSTTVSDLLELCR